MSNTPIDELEAARKEWIDAQYRWKNLLRQHDIAENQKLIGKSFQGYIEDRDCDRYIHVRSVDPLGHPTGDIISFYGADNVDIEFKSAISTDDIDIMDEISTEDYVNCLLAINVKITRLMEQLDG